MSWSSIKETVAKFAPLAGTLLGGPAGSAVGALISSALGSENTPEAVMQALGNPDNIIKLKQMEADKEKHLQAMQLQTLQAELADVQNARSEHKQSYMPSVVTVLLTLICAGLLYSVLTVEMGENNKELAFTLFGTCFTLWGSCINYWVGTTRSSAEKTNLLKSR